ncbi:hypothetical protein [Neptunicoccus sediminis]|uniref:hypothetical protein n=1 Tax=Neptunicoccus sediminis TaxID=1892596 RepID=UPI0012FFB82D|nr:hypothetical protein [Neptunicoccus sediminis]
MQARVNYRFVSEDRGTSMVILARHGDAAQCRAFGTLLRNPITALLSRLAR